MLKSSLILLLILTSCFSNNKKDKDPNQNLLFSKPYFEERTTSPDVRKIIIVGTNDFHGNIDGVKEKIIKLPENQKTEYPVGKSEIFASYMNILRTRYPKEILLLDAGDTYSGTYLSKLSYGQSVVETYNNIKYDAITIGNHEFDFGEGDHNPKHKTCDPQKVLKNLIATSKAPYVVSNIESTTTNKQINWPNVQPYLLKKVNDVNVGIIGTTTLETPDKTMREYVDGLKFVDMSKTVIDTAQILKEKGADIIILLTHSGMNCESPEKIDENLPQDSKKYCEYQKGELNGLLKNLPPGTVDAVITGHTHHLMSYYIYDIPVIQSKNNGRFFGMIELNFNLKEKKLLKDQTIIYPPTKICSYFFDTTNDCHLREEGLKFNKLIPAKFLGMEIKPDETIFKILKPYRDQLEEKNKETITYNHKKMIHHKNGVSELGTLVADSIRYVMKADVAVTNSGGIRTDLEEGTITFNDIFNIAPFENYLMTIKVTGKELKEIIKVGTSGMKEGLANFSGLDIVISESKDPEIMSDMDGDGLKKDYERDRVLSAKFSDGKEIEDSKIYTLATQTFLGESGGDNFGFIFSSIAKDLKKVNYDYTYRDAIIIYFKEVLNKLNIGYHSDYQNYLSFTKSKLEIKP